MSSLPVILGGWSGGAMVLGKLPVPGRPTIWIAVGQGLTALAVGAGGGCLDIFTLFYPFFPLSPSLWETARYRLKYCLKGPLNPNPTNNQLYLLLPINVWQSFCQTLTIWTQQHTGCALSFLNRTFSSKLMMLCMQEDIIRFNLE